MKKKEEEEEKKKPSIKVNIILKLIVCQRVIFS
jgi:hypothetical protein